MSLQAPVVYIVPEDTERVARQAFPKGNPYMLIADELGPLYANAQFASLFSSTGQPGLDPARLALITIFQFMEGLSDDQAADAVRARIDWKYALALPLTDPGFDSSVLSEFRARLVAGGLETMLLDTLLARLQEKNLLKARGRARTDSTHVLAAVRATGRLVCIGEALRAALNALAQQAPAWLREQIAPDWFERYSRRVEEYRLPKSKAERAAFAAQMGADGHRLLSALYAPSAPPTLRTLPAVQVLRAVWVQQFYAPAADGSVRWRDPQDLPPGALLIVSPYDLGARWSTKGEKIWVGYKVHVTESCDADGPHLITQVQTTPATESDEQALAPIHQALAARGLLPAEHIVDAGYVDSIRLVESQQTHQVQLVGPVPPDVSWQAQAGQGLDVGCFAVDWERQVATCPAGHTSVQWQASHDGRGQDCIHVEFARADCGGCPLRPQCTRAKLGARAITLRPREQHIALQTARAYQTSAEFKQKYAARAGIEGTLGQGVRVCELRQTRYRGLEKTRLQHLIIAVALNLWRVVAWLQGVKRAPTRISAFAALAVAAAARPLAHAA